MERGQQFPEELFHGTNVDLSEGDIIEPRTGKSWATDDAAWAEIFANDAVSLNKGSGSPRIYVVTPIDHSDVETHKYPGRNAYSSKTGFRVLRRHVHG